MNSLRKSTNLGIRIKDSGNSPIDVRIMVVGRSGGESPLLPKIMSILCEGYYDPRLRRGHIYQIIVDTINATLDKMAELSVPIEDVEDKTLARILAHQPSMLASGEMREDLGEALRLIWDETNVKRCYRDRVEVTAHASAT